MPNAHVAELLGHCGTAMLHKHDSHRSARSAVLREALGRVPQPHGTAGRRRVSWRWTTTGAVDLLLGKG